MNTRLDRALRQIAERVDGLVTDDTSQEDHSTLRNSAELIRTLARMASGKTLYQSFGAPGDWGYHTEIGKALAGLYSEKVA